MGIMCTASEAPECLMSELFLTGVVICFVFDSRRAVHGPEVQQQPMGQEESELALDKEIEGTYQNQPGLLSASGKKTQREFPALAGCFSSKVTRSIF